MKKTLLTIMLMIFSAHLFAQPSDAYLLGKMSAANAPGANFIIIKNGKPVWSKSLGKANIAANQDVDRNTIFMMASVSKTMIVTSIMQLWERGLINLDIDVNHYLPFPVRTASKPNDSITTRMLLTHTSAIKDNWSVLSASYVYGDSPVSLDSFLKNYFLPGGIFYSASQNFNIYKPGAAYNYSNVGSTLAAYLVERITGDKYSHYCDTAIFQKLCMDNTSLLLAGISDTTKIARPYYWDNNTSTYEDLGLYGYPDYPDGQLRTNITALARFMVMYMNHGTYNGTQVLNAATVDTILKKQISNRWSQGLIFYRAIVSNGDTLWGHNGGDGGVNTAMYFNRTSDVGVIVLTNGDGTSASSADVMADTLYKYGLTITPNANDTFPGCTLTGIRTIAYNNDEIAVYPNPTSGYITISSPVDGNVAITNMQGSLVMQSAIRHGGEKLSLPPTLSSGIYVIKISDAENRVMGVRKLILER